MFRQGHLDPEQNNEELEKFMNMVAPLFASKEIDGAFV